MHKCAKQRAKARQCHSTLACPIYRQQQRRPARQQASGKSEVLMWEALRQGVDEEMERDPHVCVMGALRVDQSPVLQQLARRRGHLQVQPRACRPHGNASCQHCSSAATAMPMLAPADYVQGCCHMQGIAAHRIAA